MTRTHSTQRRRPDVHVKQVHGRIAQSKDCRWETASTQQPEYLNKWSRFGQKRCPGTSCLDVWVKVDWKPLLSHQASNQQNTKLLDLWLLRSMIRGRMTTGHPSRPHKDVVFSVTSFTLIGWLVGPLLFLNQYTDACMRHKPCLTACSTATL